MRIIKTSGHCYDGCGWNDCEFWLHSEKRVSKCILFGIDGVEKDASKSLVICDKIYGRDYEGDV